MRLGRRTILAVSSIAALLAPVPAVHAHPHVFAEARLDVAVGADGTVESLKHLWRFDDLFSSTVLVEFDENKDLELDSEELRKVSDTVYESLAEFDYFQLVSADGEDVEMRAPERFVADFRDEQLFIIFEAAPAEPLELSGTVTFGIYDPTFYTAIDFVEDEYMAVENLPSGCTREVVRPDPDEAIEENQETLTDGFFNDPAGNDMNRILATRLEVSCSGSG